MIRQLQLIKVWYLNDWGIYKRRDERLCRGFAEHPDIEKVIHLEPPLEKHVEKGHAMPAGQPQFENNIITYTPVVAPVIDIMRDLLARFEAWNVDPRRAILWLNAPSAFVDEILTFFGDLFFIRIVEIVDDQRYYAPEGSDLFKKIEKSYQFSIRKADLLVSNSKKAINDFSKWCQHVLYLPNAVDINEHLYPVEILPSPNWMEWTGKRMGYVGNLNLRLRFDLFEAIASHFPECQLVIVGDKSNGFPNNIQSLPNVVTPGRIDPIHVSWFLKQCDGLLLPHVETPLTESMDPLKMYEYLASGKPIIATPVAGAREWSDRIEIASSVEETLNAVYRVFKGESSGSAQQRRSAIAGQTWQSRVETIMRSINQMRAANSNQ